MTEVMEDRWWGKGYSKEQYENIVNSLRVPKDLFSLAVEYGLIKYNYTLRDYLVEATGVDPNTHKKLKRQGYETVVIWGVQGSGKSNLMLQIGYWLIGPDWNRVLDNIVFTPKEFKDKMSSYNEEVHMPWLGWDDLGVHFSYMTYRTDIKLYEAIGQIWHAIRTKVNVVVITIPNIDDLPQNIKRNITIEVYIGRNQYMQVRRWFRLPSVRPQKDSFLIRLPVEPPHKFDLYFVPRHVFQSYWSRRLELADSALKELNKVEEEAEKARPPTQKEFIQIARKHIGIKADDPKLKDLYRIMIGTLTPSFQKINNIIKEASEND